MAILHFPEHGTDPVILHGSWADRPTEGELVLGTLAGASLASAGTVAGGGGDPPIEGELVLGTLAGASVASAGSVGVKGHGGTGTPSPSLAIGPATVASTGYGWPVDATSGKGVPLTQLEWDAVFAVAGVSGSTLAHSHAMQDASGSAVATVGTNFTSSGTMEYQQAVTGWTRKGIGFTSSSGERQGWAAGVGPNISSASALVIIYGIVDTPAANNRSIVALSNTSDGTVIRVNADGSSRIFAGGVANPAFSSNQLGVVRPWVLLTDRTAARNIAATDSENITGTYNSTITDGIKGVGGAGGISPPPMRVLWTAWFTNGNAEWTDAKIRSVLTTLGWSVAW